MEHINPKSVLDLLDETLNLKQIWDCDLLKKWQELAKGIEVSDFHKQAIQMMQKPLIKGGRSWNETELENKFISPLIIQAEIDDDEIGYFLERPLKATIDNYELSGIVDGMIATGFRNPKTPYFCMYVAPRPPKGENNSLPLEGLGEAVGMPDGQALASMLVAREMNNNQKPIYGLYVVGLNWNFMVLNGQEYCISRSYNAEIEDIFTIFKMLKALK